MIVQKYIKSPLIWGIHTGANSEVNSETSFADIKFAISRPGSGSHLMASVEAKNRGITLQPNQFVDVGTIHGAVEAFKFWKSGCFAVGKVHDKAFGRCKTVETHR